MFMKLRVITVSSWLFLASAIAVIAGGSSAGGGAQIAPADNASVSTYKSTTSSIPGGNVQDSAGGAGVQSAGSNSSSGSSSTGTTSSGGAASSNGTSAGGFSNGNGSSSSRNGGGFEAPSRPAPGASNIALEIKREKVIDTGDKSLEQATVGKAQSTDKTFAPSLLDTVSEISVVRSQKIENPVSNEASSTKAAAADGKDDKTKN